MDKISAKQLKEHVDIILEIRGAVANYVLSEGCSCCRSSSHENDAEVLAKLLGVKKYIDESGYDFYQYSPRFIKQEAANGKK